MGSGRSLQRVETTGDVAPTVDFGACDSLTEIKNCMLTIGYPYCGHVCIGTDTKLTQPGARPGQQPHERPGERTNRAWQDQTAGFYYVVVDAMLKTGFSADGIGKIGGGNFMRVFDKVTTH